MGLIRSRPEQMSSLEFLRSQKTSIFHSSMDDSTYIHSHCSTSISTSQVAMTRAQASIVVAAVVHDVRRRRLS